MAWVYFLLMVILIVVFTTLTKEKRVRFKWKKFFL
jgi:hypothetical protein